MAVIKKNNPYMEFPLQISRQYGAPIDKNSIFYSLEEAKTYALTSPLAYVGQIITVVANNDSKGYIITDEYGSIREIGVSEPIVPKVGVKFVGNNTTGIRLEDSAKFKEGDNFNSFKMYGDRKLVVKDSDGFITEVTKSYLETLETTWGKTTDIEFFIKQPKFYFQINYEKSTSTLTILLADTAFKGSKLHPAFQGENGEVYDYIYIARDYMGVDASTKQLTYVSNFNGTVGSVAGWSNNNNNYLTLTGYKDLLPDGYSLYGINELSASQLLYLVEYASLKEFTYKENDETKTASGITKVKYINSGANDTIAQFCALTNHSNIINLDNNGTGVINRTEEISVTSVDGVKEVNYRWEKHLWGGPFTCYLDGITTNGPAPAGTATIKVNGEYPIFTCPNVISEKGGFFQTFQKDLLENTGIFVQDFDTTNEGLTNLPDNQWWNCVSGNTTVGLKGCTFDYEYQYQLPDGSDDPNRPGANANGPGLFQLTFAQTNDTWCYATAKAVIKGV